jgi:hypothetical protein
VKRLERSPPSREMDDRAIEAICMILKGTQWNNGETWATIIRRRIKNEYDEKLTGRSQWMYTHFHLRRFMDKNDDEAAAHVARIWKRKKATISTHAMGHAREIALQWIEAELLRARQPFRFGEDNYHQLDVDIYAQLDITLTKLADQFPSERKVK